MVIIQLKPMAKCMIGSSVCHIKILKSNIESCRIGGMKTVQLS